MRSPALKETPTKDRPPLNGTAIKLGAPEPAITFPPLSNGITLVLSTTSGESTSVNTTPNPLTVAGIFVPGMKKLTIVMLQLPPVDIRRSAENVVKVLG